MGCLLWRRDPFLEQVLGQRKGEMIWECAEKSWDEVRRADKSWDQLSRCEKSSEDVRRGEKRWEHIRWAYMSCGELRRVEKSCENLKSWNKLRRDEKSSGDMRRDENSCDQLRRAEKRREDIRWDELRWDGMTQTAVTEGCNEQFPREVAMRWDQMKWEKIQHPKNMASDYQVKSLLLRRTGGLPVTYRRCLCSALWVVSVSNLKLPRPACPGTTCINCFNMRLNNHNFVGDISILWEHFGFKKST